MNLFERKEIKPMLIGSTGGAFDSEDYIYELKLDGIRCIAYLDKEGTDLRNKRNIRLLEKVPELAAINKMVEKPCILDGELYVLRDGRTDFFEIQRRVMTGNAAKIRLAAQRYPACFTAFDILFYAGRETAELPLLERKKLLAAVTGRESDRFSIARYIENQGKAFFAMTGERGLEGIVAKKKNSRYYFNKRTKEWIKIKNMEDEDFVICGYIYKENHVISLILGQYEEGLLTCKGHVTLGVSGTAVERIRRLQCSKAPFLAVPKGNEKAVWVKPELVCTVEYMEKQESGGYRQPVFKGLRNDKTPQECCNKQCAMTEKNSGHF